MKPKLVSLVILLGGLFSNQLANASCDNLAAAHAVRGKTYVSLDTSYPGKLHFNDDWTVTFQNAPNGHPGGKYVYEGTCNRGLQIMFIAMLGPDVGAPRFVLALEGTEDSYLLLREPVAEVLFERK